MPTTRCQRRNTYDDLQVTYLVLESGVKNETWQSLDLRMSDIRLMSDGQWRCLVGSITAEYLGP